MSIFDAKLGEITQADLNVLIDDKVPESRVLDYKREGIGRSDRDRYEFIADVASFANSAGGHLILGIEEADGIPVSVVGIDCENPDAEILRLEQMVRTGARPVLQGVEYAAVPITGDRVAVVIRIPRSWNGPHQVGPLGSFRFFGRGSNGKYQLDVDELRLHFRQGPDIAERLRTFRAGRILAIEGGALPVELEGPSLVVMHFVPISHFVTGISVDSRALSQDQNLIASLLEHGGRTRVNIDGWLATSELRGGRTRAFVQVHRNGTVESVSYWEPW